MRFLMNQEATVFIIAINLCDELQIYENGSRFGVNKDF